VSQWKGRSNKFEERFVELFVELYERNFIELKDVYLAQKWIRTLQQMRYQFPNIKTTELTIVKTTKDKDPNANLGRAAVEKATVDKSDDQLEIQRGECTMLISKNVNTMCNSVSINIKITGKHETCDGSFGTLRLSQMKTQMTLAFHFWQGSNNITKFGQKKSENEKKTQTTVVSLPYNGDYDITIHFNSIGYRGALARDEGVYVKNVPPSSSKLVAKSWITKFKIREPSTKKCHIDIADYWIDRKFYQARGSSLYDIDFLNVLKYNSPGGLAIIGASRPRTIFYDIVDHLDIDNISPVKSHKNLMFVTKNNIPISFFWHEISEDFKNQRQRGFGTMTTEPVSTIKKMGNWFSDIKLCEKQSTIAISVGSGIISRAYAPYEFDNAVKYVRNELLWMKKRCPIAKIVMVAEMALFDEFFVAEANSFRDNRNVIFNTLMKKLAFELSIEWIDAHSISLSAGRSEWQPDHAHYYSKNKKYIGDAVSKYVALKYMNATIRANGNGVLAL